MRTPEIPTPKVSYHPFYQGSAPEVPYTVTVDPTSCGRLLTTFGMETDQIQGINIMVTPEVPRSEVFENGLVTARYVPRKHRISLYPSVLWNHAQNTLASLILFTRPSATLRTIQSEETSSFSAVGVQINQFQPPFNRKQLERVVNLWLRPISAKNDRRRMIDLAQTMVDFPEAQNLLIHSINRSLRKILVHELSHAADKPASRLAQEAKDFTRGAGPLCLSYLAALATRDLPLVRDIPSLETWILVWAALGAYFGGKRIIPKLMYMIDLGEIRARKRAGRIADHPDYQDLIRTGRGWGYEDMSFPLFSKN